MSGGFSFPPPPPPPPKAAAAWNGGQEAQYSSQQSRGGQGRGRGRGSQEIRGRGRGAPESRGRGRGQQQQYQARGNQSGHQSGYGTHQRGASSGNGHLSNNSNGNPPYGTQQQPMQNQYQQSYNPPPMPSLPPGSFVNPNFAQPPTSYNNGYDGGRPFQATHDASPPFSASPQRTYAGHKRKLDALRPPPQERPRPGPQVAPAVPSFGASILPPKPMTSLPQKPAGTSSVPYNTLGLTPGEVDPQYHYSDDEAEDDEVDEEVDEEAAYAALGTKLTFEHNGAILSLSSAADLAAWKDERRKQWPTQARMTEKEVQRQRVGAERKRLLAGARLLNQNTATPNTRTIRGSGKTRRFSQEAKGDLALVDSKSTVKETEQKPLSKLEEARRELARQEAKLDSLRKKVSDKETSLQKARFMQEEQDIEAMNLMTEITPSVDATMIEANSDTEDGSDEALSDSSVVTSDSDDDDDDDGPPEESTSKHPAPSSDRSKGLLCRYFVASGYCRDGDTCRFRHELAPRGTAVQSGQRPPQPVRDRDAPRLDPSATAEKKSIYQRLMEQQHEEEDRLVLQVVKHLGAAGFFSLDATEGESS